MIIPLVILLSLAVLGGGLLPGVVPGCAVVAVFCLLILHPPKTVLLRGLWWTGQLTLLCLLLTWIPLPRFLIGAKRQAHFDQVEQAFADYQQLPVTPTDKSASVDVASIPPFVVCP